MNPSGEFSYGAIRYPRYDTDRFLFVLKDHRDGTYYFQATSVAYCLGYTDVEKAVQDHIPEAELHKERIGNLHCPTGFIKIQTVRDFVDKTTGKDEVRFKQWFEEGLQDDNFLEMLNRLG